MEPAACLQPSFTQWLLSALPGPGCGPGRPAWHITLRELLTAGEVHVARWAPPPSMCQLSPDIKYLARLSSPPPPNVFQMTDAHGDQLTFLKRRITSSLICDRRTITLLRKSSFKVAWSLLSRRVWARTKYQQFTGDRRC